MSRKLTVRERMDFYWEIVNNSLNKDGQIEFYDKFYWEVDYRERLTHEVLDFMERQLYSLVLKKDYVREA